MDTDRVRFFVDTESAERWLEHTRSAGDIVPHWHAYEEVLTLIEGRVSIKLDEMTYELCAPTSIRIAPGMLHSLTNHVAQPARLLAYHATTAPKNEYPDGRPAPVQWEAD